MWMGTYPSVPSRLASSGELLSDHVKRNPILLGETYSEKYGREVPFLPKVRA
jgi:mannose-6-phosphate isomerase